MTLTDLASLGTLVSSVAVLASLVYLARQTRQNILNSQALIQQGRAARVADTALRIAELRGDPGIQKCFDGANEVSEQDIARFINIARAVFVSAEDSYLQQKQGLLGDLAFASFEASVRAGMGAPGIAAAWLISRDMYEPEFRSYLDKTLGDANTGPAGGMTRGLERWKAAMAELSGTGQG